MDITSTSVWQQLSQHADTMKSQRMAKLFETDPARADEYTIDAAGLYLDYSKNLIDSRALELLLDLATSVGLGEQIQQMYRGERVNITEGRAALHTLLRSRFDSAPTTLQQEAQEVASTLQRMKNISNDIRNGKWRGASGRPLKSIIHIGIGGSYLGPKMVAEALAPYADSGITAYYIANVDGQHIEDVLGEVDPNETLIVIVSKTFTTTETMTNAHTARQWLTESIPGANPGNHLIAVTSNSEAATAFGLYEANILPMADWVGGRYSLWSAVGITVAITHGFELFAALLRGAEAMDRHFLEAPFSENMPALLALIGVWYHNFYGTETHAVIPYDHSLRLLPAHLQQLDMESNGKSVTLDGTPVTCTTGPVVWGGEGTNGQHAFHQLLHQGTRLVSLDFIVAFRAHHRHLHHHDLLVANCLAQSEALMNGQQTEDIVASLRQSHMTESEVQALAPHKTMTGNRPSNTIVMPQLTPESLGALIALYEHKVFFQARIWQINPFDQWGVELGKALSETIYDQITDDHAELKHDPSTNKLVKLYKTHRNSA
ncbi:MAG: glucose-6-phosphate isomerase [Pseudomonadales bacterium]